MWTQSVKIRLLSDGRTGAVCCRSVRTRPLRCPQVRPCSLCGPGKCEKSRNCQVRVSRKEALLQRDVGTLRPRTACILEVKREYL